MESSLSRFQRMLQPRYESVPILHTPTTSFSPTSPSHPGKSPGSSHPTVAPKSLNVCTCLTPRPIYSTCTFTMTLFSVMLACFQGAHRPANYPWLSEFLLIRFLHKFMQAEVSWTKDNENVRNSGKAKLITTNIKGPNLAAVMRTAVQESELLL